MRQYKLIVGDRYSLSNETDSDIMTDYFPGIWAIKSKKSAIECARQIQASGDEISSVTNYDNPVYYKVSNEIIKELGIKQKLYKEPRAVEQTTVTNNKPATLSALKKYLTKGVKTKVTNYSEDGEIRNERETEVLDSNTTSVVLAKGEGRSWLYYGKASNWAFNNDGATYYDMGRGGEYVKSTQLTY